MAAGALAVPAPEPRWPAVSVVIATRDRPQMLRRAVDAVLAQRYEGAVEVVVVFDGAEPDLSLIDRGVRRRVRVVVNTRTPGLAGARNTGALVATAPLLAFCDDDDVWLPGKLADQVETLAARPECDAVLSGIIVRYEDRRSTVRVPSVPTLAFADLLRSRVAEAHPSTLVVRRAAFFERIGMVDEAIPGSYGEDYEWLLRAAEQGPVALVPAPLVAVTWGASSHFRDRWETIAAAIDYLLARRPEFASEPVGLARLLGRRAFALAAAGRRRAAVPLALRAIRLNPRDRRGYLALVVVLRLASARRLTELFNARGAGVV